MKIKINSKRLKLGLNDHQEYFHKAIDKIKALANLKGKNHALDGFPQLNATSLYVFVELIQAQFNTLVADNRERIELQLNEVQSILYNSKCSLTNLWKRKNELEHHSQSPLMADDITESKSLWNYIWLFSGMTAVILMMAGEWILLGQSFQALAKSRPLSILMGAGFSVVLYMTLHYGHKVVEKVVTPVWKKIIIIAEIILIATSLIIVAILRTKFLHKANGIDINVFWFVVLNMFFAFGLFLAIHYCLKPAIKKIREARASTITSKTPGQELKDINKKIEELEVLRDAMEEQEKELLILSKSTELKILRAYFECIAIYKDRNIDARGVIPDSFWQTKPPPLHFYYIGIEDVVYTKT